MTGSHVRARRGGDRDALEIDVGQRLAQHAGLLEDAQLGVDEDHQPALDAAKTAFARERKGERLDADLDAGLGGHLGERTDGLFR